MQKAKYYIEVFKAFVYLTSNHGLIIAIILFSIGGGKC